VKRFKWKRRGGKKIPLTPGGNTHIWGNRFRGKKLEGTNWQEYGSRKRESLAHKTII